MSEHWLGTTCLEVTPLSLYLYQQLSDISKLLFSVSLSLCVCLRDVLCGFLLCTNMSAKPSFGELQGDLTSMTIYHQNKYLDCR